MKVINMARRMKNYVDELNRRYPVLTDSKKEILNAYQMMRICYQDGGKLLIAGNGGSAADSEHMAGELMKRFQRPRPIDIKFAEKLRNIDMKRGSQLAYNLEQPLMAIPLVAHESLLIALVYLHSSYLGMEEKEMFFLEFPHREIVRIF